MSSRSRLRGVVATAIALASSMLPLVTGTASEASPPSLCNQVSIAEVSATLNVKATSVSAQVNGGVTVCWYKVGANSQAVFVRSQTQDTLSGFNVDKKMAKTQGESPKPDLNLKPYPAFSTSLGSASYGITYSVTVLKKTIELSLGGVNVKLSNVESLAKKILPIL